MSQSTLEKCPSEGRWRRAFRPRYSPLDLVLLTLALTFAVSATAFYICEQFRRQRDEFRRQREELVEAAFRSPLPAVTLSKSGPNRPDDQTYHARYEFTQDWFTPHIPVWEAALASYRGKPGVTYLEVGLYEGRSAFWMLENILTDPTSHLTGIDLFDGELKDRFFENLRRSGAEDRATIVIQPSQVELRKLPLESFDIIYIDGSHATPDVLEDAVLSYRLLKPGGVLIFDDYQWSGALNQGPLTHDASSDFPKAAIDSFVQCFADRVRVIHVANQLIVKKKGR